MSILALILLHVAILIYSGGGICAKLAAGQEMFSPCFFLFYILEFVILAVYAVLWQQVIKRVELSVAYSNRAVLIVWSLVWAVLVFHEKISLWNVGGIVLVALGIYIINSDREAA